MRSPVSRIAATVLFVLVIAGVALWFHAGNVNFALADFIQPIIEAKSVKYQMTIEMEGMPATTCDMTVLASGQQRRETTIHNTLTVQIDDPEKGKSLLLYPSQKRASIHDIPKGANCGNAIAEIRSPLLAVRDNPDVKPEPLGEKEIDGLRVVGYRLVGPGTSGCVMDVWGDPKTGLPIRVELALGTGAKSTLSGFEFNVNVDESLLSVEPPPGFAVDEPQEPDAVPDMFNNLTEQDLIETFRQYADYCEGALPKSLDLMTGFEISRDTLWAKVGVMKGQRATDQQQRENWANAGRLRRGVNFVLHLRRENDAHYVGKGVSLGTPGTPIFWYRPKDAKNYRVIYADLSVREMEAPPDVPNAQPIWTQPGPKE